MKLTTIALLLMFFTGCASRQPARTALVAPPAANDWTTEYIGQGSVKTTITNAAASALFLNVRSGEATAAQAELGLNASRDLNLAPGPYVTEMKITHGSKENFYRGPGFVIPSNTARMNLRLQVARHTNLVPISRKEFER